jgi:DNA-binding ferritin-like protein (Dps family)
MKVAEVNKLRMEFDEMQSRAEVIMEEFQEEFDERSEKWQESEAGEAAQARIDVIQAVIDALGEAIEAL